MIKDDIKLMLGDSAVGFSDEQIMLAYRIAVAEIEDYCQRPVDENLEFTAVKMAVFKLGRIGSEGLASQSFSGVSESYMTDYPADIKSVLNRKRRVKII